MSTILTTFFPVILILIIAGCLIALANRDAMPSPKRQTIRESVFYLICIIMDAVFTVLLFDKSNPWTIGILGIVYALSFVTIAGKRLNVHTEDEPKSALPLMIVACFLIAALYVCALGATGSISELCCLENF